MYVEGSLFLYPGLLFLDQRRIYPEAIKTHSRVNVQFHCFSNTLPYLTHNDHILPANAMVFPNHSLTLRDVSSDNNGYYECMGTTSTGPFFARAYFLVTRKHM